MIHNEWLQSLKVGDSVILRTGFRGGTKRVVPVDRLTKTQIILSGDATKYSRKDGYAIGRSAFNFRSITKATPETIKQVDDNNIRVSYVDLLNNTAFHKLPTLKLEKLVKVLAEII